MIYQIAICDDCMEDRNRLRRLLAECQTDSVRLAVTEYCSGEELLADKGSSFHAIFLDIQMGKYNGQETAMLLRQKDRHVILSFYTGVVEPTSESFRVQPYRYLMKNDEDRILKVDINEILAYVLEKNQQPVIWAQAGSVNICVQLDDIVYISKCKRGSVQIWTTKEFYQKIGSAYQTVELMYSRQLDFVYDELKQYGFEYAHSSYIVNFQHVIVYTRTEILMKDHIPLALTRSKATYFRQCMKEYLMKKVDRNSK